VPRLACIIPVLGTTDGLETTLVSVLERRPDDCELAVVLNVPYDDPYQLSGEVKFLDAPRAAGLVECLNLGIGATRAPIIHTLACGYEVADGWLDRAQSHFADPRVAALAPSIHNTNHQEQLVAAGVGYDRGGSKITAQKLSVNGLQCVGPLLQAAFIRRESLDAFGGILPSAVGDEFADIELALTLRRAGWQIRFDSQCQVYAPSIEQSQPTGISGGLHAERLFWRHWSETGRLAGLVAHPWTAISNVLGSTWQAPLTALGRFLGLCELGAARSYRQTLAAATAAAEQAAAEWQWRSGEPNRQESTARGQSFRIDQAHPTGHRVEAETTRSSKHSSAARN
jgi:hypothetical protein